MVAPLPVGLPLTIYDNVAFAPRCAGHDATGPSSTRSSSSCLRQAALWDEVKDRLDSLGTKLSGGQQQRLTIARALSHQPEILCLDEFSIAIDPVTTMRIEDVLKELRKDDDDHPRDQPDPAGAPAGRPHDVPAGTARSSSSTRNEVDLLGAARQTGGPTTTSTGSSDERPPPTSHRDPRRSTSGTAIPGADQRRRATSSTGIITSLIGPSRLRQDHAAALLQPGQRALRLRHAPTGEIELLGKNIYDPDVSLIELRKAVGMVFQRPNPLPISVYENVVFGLRIHSDRARARRGRAGRGGREGAHRGRALERPQGPAARRRPRPCSSSSSRSSASRACCRSSPRSS